MIAVVCAAFDADGDAAIAALRERIRGAGVRVPREPAHRPHFTLGATEIGRPEPIADLAEQIALRHAPLTVRLERIGTFGRGRVLWAGPAPDTGLAALQRDVHTTLGRHHHRPAFGDQTSPRRWVAHCTLGRQADPAAVRRATDGFEPFDLRVTALVTLVVGGRGDIALAPLAEGG